MDGGYIYFLTNKSMPGLVKIGHTTQDVESRVRQLNSTGVPSPFLLAACVWVGDSAQVEATLHALLADHRHSANREFFEGSVAELLGQAMPVLVGAMGMAGLSTQDPRPKRAHDLESLTIELLSCLAGEERMFGYTERRLIDWFRGEPALKIEAHLAHLKELRLVSEKRSRNEWEGATWKITSEGKKFLFDHGHVTHDMLR